MVFSIPPYETVLSWAKGLLPMFKRSWQRLNGPAIEARLFHPKLSTWQLEVRNTRGGVAISRVFLQIVADGKDNDIGEVTSAVELYPSETLEPVRLFGNARAVYSKVDPIV